MRLALDTHYKADFDGETSRFRERVELEFEEVAAADAPIAVEWDGGCTRWFGGRHYKDFGVGVEMLTDNYLDLRVGSEDRKFAAKRYPLTAESQERAAALEAANRFARDCLIIDGRPWLVCAEPSLWASPEGVRIQYQYPSTKKGRYLRYNECGMSPEVATTTFRADEFEAALRFVPGDAQTHDVPVIHEPSSLNLDPVRDGLIVCAQALCHLYSKVEFEEMNPIVAAHLAELRACTWNREPDEVDFEELADRAERAVHTVRTQGRKRGLAWMDRAIKRWHDRSMGDDLRFPASFTARPF
ncbi:hypothetical protein OIU34_20525 [Pararhizobium sp. BT-229]|uniref:hypothetical protein n=1 Tax=Pararhizobium sp. BT-229 TaxID=2986923 RepID=UPI0021F7F727|nr:hypothetical protein [Pararhizobium sp. BT-229]MCV9964275.1 hypothetical protein [Pararhizobium sp. BT-229]